MLKESSQKSLFSQFKQPLPELLPNQIKLFQLDLSSWRPSCDNAEPFIDLLDDTEYRRYSNFKFPTSQNTFLAGRTSLKYLLAHYLNADMADIAFKYNEYGKPELLNPRPIHFNVSHSGDHLVIAISSTCNVGVDIECVKPAREYLNIAKSFFAPTEYDLLLSLNESDKAIGFYKIWSLKESYIKAKSQGLSISLSDFQFRFQSVWQTSHFEFANQLGDDTAHWQFYSTFINTSETKENNSAALSLSCENATAQIDVELYQLN